MAVLVEGISIILKASAITDKYPGGWESFKAEVPNQTLCADGELIRIGFMSPDDVKGFIDDLCKNYPVTIVSLIVEVAVNPLRAVSAGAASKRKIGAPAEIKLKTLYAVNWIVKGDENRVGR